MNKHRESLTNVMVLVHIAQMTRKFLLVETDDAVHTTNKANLCLPVKSILGARDHLREYPTRDYQYLHHLIETGKSVVLLVDDPGWTSDPAIATQLAPYKEQGIIRTIIWNENDR